MIKELLNSNLTLLLKSNRVVVQDIEHYVKQCSFKNVLKESIFLLIKVGLVRSLNELRAVSTTELFSVSTNNALKVG
ncbi:ankyrin repeat domain protein [Rickettsia parkeri str. Tate's Hell]|uniref:Ankyrin repeat domain protein n=1 Tax=Rickettsia parkeri str. Tate's Hell TaxID=1359189 RepID=A0ABR5DP44_RICPA|nr:hypothetical protein [Rickettsia parkeri]AFC75062.1 ankyrin repeat-containing protein [Rickettsia parkeri str. Portsmouth]KJV94759.1 ankyrin repeat domain protein [Rickettsia parkeri str. Grand Bay]KJV95663.1 ankyrin repeat domain protein [Rickettsia parkeri str. AT\